MELLAEKRGGGVPRSLTPASAKRRQKKDAALPDGKEEKEEQTAVAPTNNKRERYTYPMSEIQRGEGNEKGKNIISFRH